jgi:TetR/AcrR family transcriptional regulator, transcriptional repressor for nem operon
MVRYNESHRAKTQAAIINAAGEMLRDKGFTDTSVGNVMKAVGLTHGGFYAHFADKNAMLGAAVEQAFVQSPKNFTALAEMAKVRGDVGLIAKHYLADSRIEAVATGCPAAALVSEVHRQDQTVKEVFQGGTQETVEALSNAPGLEGDNAWAALAMLVGGLSLMRALPDQQVKATIREEIIKGLRQLASSSKATP